MAFLRTHFRQLCFLAFLPILAGAPALSGLFKCDPELMHSGLDVGLGGYIYPGAACYLDPDVAYITQPLGFLSAQDWLHAIIPWWNPYTGVGMPLAAEMQPQSFFLPFIFLLHFHDGWLVQRIILQILTAWFTYLFLLEIGVSMLSAYFAGGLFALNGAFILTPHAVVGPIFCLPLTLLGIEFIAQAARDRQPFGWCLLAISLALSIYAGFPEVAYFDGLLALGWAGVRCLQLRAHERNYFVGKLIVGGLTGIVLTAPIVNAFAQYLMNGNVGGHVGAFAQDVFHAMGAPVQMFPLLYGSLARFPPPNLSDQGLWITVGGWFGSIPVLLALVGSCRPIRRLEAYFLLAWVLFFEARYFGLFGVRFLVNLIPGASQTDLLRFSPVAVSFAVFTLASFGLDELRKPGGLPKKQFFWLLGAYGLFWLASFVPVIPILPQWFGGYPKLIPPATVFFGAVLVSNGFTIWAILRRQLIIGIPCLAVLGAICVFLLSQLPAPRHGYFSTAGTSFLQSHQGLARSYTIGPLGPNYAAQYHIAQINYEEVPAPLRWTDFVQSALFPDGDVLAFGGFQNHQAEDFISHAATFESVGVEYLIANPGEVMFKNGQIVDDWDGYIRVSKDRPVQNVLPASILHPAVISSVSVVVGTYYGLSTRVLSVRLCNHEVCASGGADLSQAVDNQPFSIPLSQPLNLSAGENLSIQFLHPAGKPVAVWLPSGLSSSDYTLQRLPDGSARLILNKSPDLPYVPRIYHDVNMDIYQLPNPAPYVAAINDACTLQVYSRQKFDTNCRYPTTLVRRELFYPGWRATVNGAPVPLTQTEEIFQQIPIPAGPAKIRFTYMPPYTPLASAAALAAALFWFAAAILSRRRGAKI